MTNSFKQSFLLFILCLAAAPLSAQPDYSKVDAEAEFVFQNLNLPESNYEFPYFKNYKNKQITDLGIDNKEFGLSTLELIEKSKKFDENGSIEDGVKFVNMLMKYGYGEDADKYLKLILKNPKVASFGDNVIEYQLALNALFMGNFSYAINYAKKALKRYELNSEARQLLAISYAETGETKNAEKPFERLAQNGFKESLYYKLFIQSAFDKCKSTAEVNYASAMSYFQKKDYFNSYLMAVKAVRCNDSHLPAQQLLYELESQGKVLTPENTAKAYGSTIINFAYPNYRKQKIMRLENKAIPKIDEFTEEAKTAAYDEFIKVGETALDDEYFNKAFTAANNAVIVQPNKAEGYILRAKALFNMFDINSKILAWTDASKAINLDAKNEEAYQIRGRIFRDIKKDYVSAIYEFSKGIGLAPNFYQLYLERGFTFLNQKNYDAATKDFDMVIKLKPENPNVYYAKSIIAEIQKDVNRQIKFIEIALEKIKKIEDQNNGLTKSQKNLDVTLRIASIKAYDATGEKSIADLEHELLLLIYYDNPLARALDNRNPSIVAKIKEQEDRKTRRLTVEVLNKQINSYSKHLDYRYERLKGKNLSYNEAWEMRKRTKEHIAILKMFKADVNVNQENLKIIDKHILEAEKDLIKMEQIMKNVSSQN